VRSLALVALAAIGVGGCTPTPAAAPPAPPTRAVAPPPPAAPPPEVAAPRTLDSGEGMGPSPPGFTFCCGRGSYKIEIDCREMLKRCYERRGRRWQATYGRHCKRVLGESCYLDQCSERCRQESEGDRRPGPETAQRRRRSISQATAIDTL
jgi:hypothetical protein